MLFKYSFSFFGRSVSFILRSIEKKSVLHYGVGNRCKDGYVLFLDYDDTPIDWVLDEIDVLHHRFRNELGTAYIFLTKHGVHVVFLEKSTLGRILNFLESTSCDKEYQKVPMLYGRKVWVLRQSKKKDEKIIYRGFVKNPYDPYGCKAERSRAHALYLKQYCGVPRKDLEFESQKYNTGAFDLSDRVTMGYYHIAERNN